MAESVPVSRRLTDLCRNEHVELLDGLNNKTAWSKEADLGYGNQVVSVAHDDRTVLELVQNARDAIIDGDGDGHVSVIVGPESLIVANTGSPFRLDDEDVFSAVTSLGRSAKAQDRGSIGEKGVGLKSILQLSEQFSIYSRVDNHHLSAHFSRARAARMVLAMYDDLLDEPRFTGQLQDGSNNSLLEEYRSLVDEVDADVYPEYLDVDQIRAQLLEGEQEPPSPASILGDLPRLSLFRYPFPDGAPNSDLPLRSSLIEGADSAITSSNRLGDDLQSWLGAEENTFTTIIELDYVDSEWRTLLDRVDSGLDGIDTEALSTFRNNRSSTTTDQDEFAKQRQEALWEECTSISPETLILLGQIDQMDLVRVTRDEGGTLRMDDYREITVESGDTTRLPDAPAVSQRPVTYTKAESRDDDPITYTREFRQYTRTYSNLSDSDEQEETEDDIHLLIERPQLDAEWHPTSKPLFLFYPIEEVETPFPFAVHAPFRVDFDRQSLAEDDQNQRILEKLPALIADAATDLATSKCPDTGSTMPFAKWMPWLMTPVAPVHLDDKTSAIGDAIQKTFDRLRDEPIVPTDTGEPEKPSETLVDPQRLLAFEALRERSPNPPLPAAGAIKTGQAWRNAVVADPEEFGEWTANIGLTEILDRPRDNEGGRGSIDLLCEHWEASDVSASDWAISVNDTKYAEQYFGAVHGILQSASEGDELDLSDGTVAKEAAKKLGNEKVPLLPAEAHQKGSRSETTSVTHLVRARSRSTTGDGGASRSERIVFRRAASSGDSDRSSIGNLPTPPDELPVFVIPFRTNWSGALEGYNRDWGTLVLLGGGLALADGLAATDATQWLADASFGTLAGASILLVVLVVVAVTVLLSELASNTAVVAIFAPVLITIGPQYAGGLGTTGEGAAVFLAITGAVAASFGFALPVATPPNAIAFGTGAINREHMLRAGWRLDVVMVVLATAGMLVTFRVAWPLVF
ncbi:SLC13 family permease [Halolamina sp. C58]|uniref:SLC13 family permease n=1 Tax=Halolamina sp. C58 TaxID=3421640 RepID=UPI003EBA35F9